MKAKSRIKTRAEKAAIKTEQCRAKDMRRLQRHRERMMAAKTDPCMDCGLLFPPICMDFDHVRGSKRSNVSAMKHMSDDLFYAEIAKCDLVCSNCHRIRTQQRGYGGGRPHLR